MKNLIIRIVLFLGYLVPYVFLAMNEDALSGTLWFYLVMILSFGALCYFSAKTQNTFIILLGNILSFISSCIFAWNFQTEKWEYYFKPFLPNQLIIFETVVAVIIQAIIAISLTKKHKKLKSSKNKN